MQTSVILAVLLAACLHATWNATVKSSGDKLVSIAGIQFAGGLIAFVLLPFFPLPAKESWPYLFASIVLHSAYYIALSEAYRKGDFAEAYPIARGTAPIIVTLCGVFFLNETLDPFELIAVLGILVGIMIFATRRLDRVVQDTRAITAALITSVFIAAYTLVDGMGGRLSGAVSGYMVWLTLLDAIPIVVYTLIVRRPKVFPVLLGQLRMSFLGAGMALASYWIVVWAMTQGAIPIVSALRETSIIIAALIGAYYFKEPSGKRRVIASIIIFLSILLLTFDA